MPSLSSNSSSSGNKDFCYNFWTTGYNDGESLPTVPPEFSCDTTPKYFFTSSDPTYNGDYYEAEIGYFDASTPPGHIVYEGTKHLYRKVGNPEIVMFFVDYGSGDTKWVISEISTFTSTTTLINAINSSDTTPPEHVLWTDGTSSDGHVEEVFYSSFSSQGVSEQSSQSDLSSQIPPSSVDQTIYLYEKCCCGEAPVPPEESSMSGGELSSGSSFPTPPGCEGKTRLKIATGGGCHGYLEAFTSDQGTAIYSNANPTCEIFALCDSPVDTDTYTFAGTTLKSGICARDYSLIDTLSIYQSNVDADCKKRCPESSLSSQGVSEISSQGFSSQGFSEISSQGFSEISSQGFSEISSQGFSSQGFSDPSSQSEIVCSETCFTSINCSNFPAQHCGCNGSASWQVTVTNYLTFEYVPATFSIVDGKGYFSCIWGTWEAYNFTCGDEGFGFYVYAQLEAEGKYTSEYTAVAC